MKLYANGGCLCGAVRYECIEAPLMAGNCHCRDCQRNSGGAFTTLMVFKIDTVKIMGEGVSRFTHRGGSDQAVERCFCATCGSPVSTFYEVTPDFTVIFAGTLDDPSLIRPQWNIYIASKQPWVVLPPHLISFDGGYQQN